MKRLESTPSSRALIFSLLSMAALFAGFWHILQKLIQRWGSGDNSYAYLVFPLFLYLLWEIKEDFDFDTPSWTWAGLFAAALSIILILIGELSSVEALLFTGIWGCVISIIITNYGWRSKQLLFPIAILLFIVPLPPYINQIITFKLKLLASTMSADMLRAVGVSVLQEGNILDLGVEKLQVVDACSGLRYLMSMVLMALLIGYYFARQWWRQAILLVLVPPMLIIMNAVRIFLSGMFTVNGHPELASDTAHDLQGILFFLLAGLIFWGVAKLLAKIVSLPVHQHSTRLSTSPTPTKANQRKGIYITTLLCLLFIISGYFIQQSTKSPTSPTRKTFSMFPGQIGEWQSQRHYLSPEILNALWADDYISASYFKKSSPNTIYLLIPFYNYQGTRHTAHAPQSCLLGGGYEIVESKLHVTPLADNSSIKLMTMLMRKDDQRMLASYFFFQRGRIITNPWLNKYYLLKDAILKNRTDGALVRVEIVLGQNQSVDDAYKILNEFLGQLWPLLPEYVPY